MRSILVPIDFSETSINAMDYAANLAALGKIKLHLLHVMHVPIVDETQIGNTDLMAQSTKEAEDKLHELESGLRKRHFVLEVESHTKFGLASDSIVEESDRLIADLVVMGSKGMTDLVSKVFGSISQAVTNRSTVPVLVVPKNAKLSGVDKLVMSEDHKDISDRANHFVEDMLRIFNADLDIISVEPNNDAFRKEEIYEKDGVKEVSVWDKTVVDGIRNYTKESGADIICARKHDRDFISDLFHTSTTKALIADNQTPVLILK